MGCSYVVPIGTSNCTSTIGIHSFNNMTSVEVCTEPLTGWIIYFWNRGSQCLCVFRLHCSVQTSVSPQRQANVNQSTTMQWPLAVLPDQMRRDNLLSGGQSGMKGCVHPVCLLFSLFLPAQERIHRSKKNTVWEKCVNIYRRKGSSVFHPLFNLGMVVWGRWQ